MGQQGSARLTVHSRLAIAKRVTEEGWSITEAAVAASVSHRRPRNGFAGSSTRVRPVQDHRSTRPPAHPPTRGGRHRAEDRTVAGGSPRHPPDRMVARHGTLQCLRRVPSPGSWTPRSRRASAPTRSLRVAGPGDPRAPEHEEARPDGSRTGKRFDPTQRGRTRRLGWTVVHIAIDDHSRLAYVEELPDGFGETAAAFLLGRSTRPFPR
jgi:hypothetical protein